MSQIVYIEGIDIFSTNLAVERSKNLLLLIKITAISAKLESEWLLCNITGFVIMEAQDTLYDSSIKHKTYFMQRHRKILQVRTRNTYSNSLHQFGTLIYISDIYTFSMTNLT